MTSARFYKLCQRMICSFWTSAVFCLVVTPTGRIAAQESRSAAKAAGNGWPEYGGNLAGQRYSSEKQITPLNVVGLQPAWVVHTHVFDNPSKSKNWRTSSEATPVLWRGTLYFDTPFDEIFAVDAETGKIRWKFDPSIDREKPIYIVASRGVSLWHAKRPGRGVCASDRVLVATLDRRLIARDAATGQACSSFGEKGTVDLARGVEMDKSWYYGFTSPPTVVGDTIILGSSVADSEAAYAASGAIRGFDAVTGRQKWSWEPVRWNAEQHPKVVGSGNAWSVISADAEHDLVFVPTGSPSVDYYGGLRLGDNRDADSIVALKASTGERVWAFQLVHHDIWDYDTPSEPVLFTFRGTIPAVAVATKTSMVYVFNRLTGEPLYPVVEKPVPKSNLVGEEAWATQPFSTLPPLTPLSFTSADIHLHNPSDQKYCEQMIGGLENQGLFTPPSVNGSLVFPGPAGGANWGSSAFDPATSILYTRVSNIPFLVKEVLKPPLGHEPWIRAERLWMHHAPWWAGGFPPRRLSSQFQTPDGGGEVRDESPQDGTPYVLQRQALMTPSGIPCAPAPFGSIVAINLATGKKVWSVAHGVMVQGEPGSMGIGGVIVTAGGLLFAASTNDPYLRAYDSASGKELWRGNLPVASNATPMTYGVNGRQYVVIAAGGHGFIGTGKSDEVIAFALPKPKRAK
jgi:quinoprotein glucose dehydrogenase